MNSSGVCELLAPAGDEVCLHAAVRAGADAVYLGAGAFNARRGAGNFTLESLARACDYAHLRGVAVYLTFNTVVLESEFAEAMELARQAWRAGVDAFIVQDIGIASELTRTLPQARLHISTQMNTHNLAGIEAAALLGAKRVTLAREMSLPEIERLSAYAAELGIEVETFVHGALCVCYSGQCLMSSLIGGRSANRGMCAQACRLPYTLHNRALRKTLPSDGEHLLSPKDLRAIELLPAHLEAGVSSLKIEGRMKSPEYVHAVVSAYRAALDDIAAGVGLDSSGLRYTPSQEVNAALNEAFSRGFTTAYLEGRRDNAIMSYGRPNNRGVSVGRVARAEASFVDIDTKLELEPGDVLEFWTGKGYITETVESIKHIGSSKVRIPVSKRIMKGDRVFRVRSAALAFADDAQEPRLPVCGSVRVCIGEPLSMTFSAGDCTVYEEAGVVEPARTKPVSAEEVREHVDRLGNLPFVLESLDVLVDEGASVGFSQVHKLRTRALTHLADELLAPHRNRVLPRVERHASAPRRNGGSVEVVAFATNPACARAAKRAGADLVFAPALNYQRGTACIAGQVSGTAEQAGYPGRCAIALPVVDHDTDGVCREQATDFNPWSYVKPGKPVFVENLSQLVRATSEGASVELGPHLPILNTFALERAAALGAERVWLSPEHSLADITRLGESACVPLGITVIGSQELMITEHCLLMSQGACNEDCANCARRKSPHYLKDRKGYEFPVVTDRCGRGHLYNSVQLDIAHLVPDLMSAGISALMVDTTLMNVEEAAAAVARVVRARDIARKGDNRVGKTEGATSGHMFRGVK